MNRPAWRVGFGVFARLTGAALAWTAATAAAHQPSDAFVQLDVADMQVHERIDIAVRDLDRELTLDADADGAVTWGELRSRWSAVSALAEAGVQWTAAGARCRVTGPALQQLDEHGDARFAVLTRRWACDAPVHALVLRYRMFSGSDPTHRGIVRVGGLGAGQAAVLAPDAVDARFGADAGPAGSAAPRVTHWPNVLASGVHHILVGVDHIAFLLALLLPAVLRRHGAAPPAAASTASTWHPAATLRPVLWDVLRTVTAFTVAHSITLALAALGIVNPSPRWVESLIAASVVFAALNNLVPVVREGRWRLTFAFGLVHGFGFAGALRDVGLEPGALAGPLVAFNLGVELGQVGIVLLVMPLAWMVRQRRFYIRWVLGGGSLLIAAVATAWVVERAFDARLLPQWGA